VVSLNHRPRREANVITSQDLPTMRTVEEVAALFRRSGETVRLWITRGIVVNRRRVKLAAYRVGGQWMVTTEGIDAFLAATNPEPPVCPESPAAQARRIKANIERVRQLCGGRL
jgi:hypothetical protein